MPLSHKVLAGLPAEAVEDELTGAGVPEDLRAAYWAAVRGNIETRKDAGRWWPVFRDGAEPDVADEDRDFVAEALSLLPEPPYTAETWSDWTSAVKEKTGRKGKALFMPLRLAVTGAPRGPEMAEVMPLLRKKPQIT